MTSSDVTLPTPAACNCSSRAAALRLSSAASWATVVLAIQTLSMLGFYVGTVLCGKRARQRACPSVEPVFPCFHDQRLGVVFTDAGHIDQLVDGQLGQIVARVNIAFGQLADQFRGQAVERAQILRYLFHLFF